MREAYTPLGTVHESTAPVVVMLLAESPVGIGHATTQAKVVKVELDENALVLDVPPFVEHIDNTAHS